MHRPTIGLIAAVLFLIGVATLWHGDESISSACLRIGTVMVILWFAQPQLKHVPPWLAIFLAVGLLVVAYRPKMLVMLLPLAAALWFLRPRPSRAGRARRYD